MADAEKLTLRAPLVVVMIIFTITATISCFTIGVKMINMVANVNSKLDIYIASNEATKAMGDYRISQIEISLKEVVKQSNINTLNVKTLADLIEAKKIKLEDYE